MKVKAERKARRYDEERGCYVYDVSFKTSVPLTDRTIEVSRAFGLGVDEEREHVLYRDFDLKLSEGDVVYITGDSGSGKSVLLRAIEADLGDEAANIDDVDVDRDTPIIDTVGHSFREALGLLSKVGLNDAFLFLRRYRELSEGQRYRYRIARTIDGGKEFWIADEFCSTLDRITAKIVAYNIQKLARRNGATLVVATTHDDLGKDLNPSICIRKGWGEEVEVDYRSNVEASRCTAVEGITIEEGTREDYERLSHLHYRDARLPVPREIYAMKSHGKPVGVIAYSYTAVRASGRKKAVGYTPDLEELNRDWAVISRVIVHPKYRTTGLGSRLISETLPIQGCRHVELIAVMAQYNPFAERAGMRLIQVKEPHRSIIKAVEETRRLGFNPIHTASAAYNKNVLDSLPEPKHEGLEQALLGVGALYYKRLSGAGRPYLKKNEFKEWLNRQDAEGLARALTVLNTLNQTKAYLYWSMEGGGGGVP
ncbi:GNAT family N-acetyltransferase [Candidatus Bathyarchaeota archaeon]|nr:GNAT family N-acetyltransferase [Candidatus Bathyarchaeota archaeon]